MADFPLGLIPPPDDAHRVKHPLRLAAPGPLPRVDAVVVGLLWRRAWDVPVRLGDGSWWIGREARLESPAGGHAICAVRPGTTEPQAWRAFFDQTPRQSCGGWSAARMCAVRHRRRFSGDPLYDAALLIDPFPGEADAGTTLRAVFDVLRDQGPSPVRKGAPDDPRRALGLSANLWPATAAEALRVIGADAAGYVALRNSWGSRYPGEVRMDAELFARLWESEYAEMAVPVYRLDAKGGR